MKMFKKAISFLLCFLFTFMFCVPAFAVKKINGFTMNENGTLSFECVEGKDSYVLGAYVEGVYSSNGGSRYESDVFCISEGEITVNGTIATIDAESVKPIIRGELNYFQATGKVPVVLFLYYYDEDVTIDSDEIKITVDADTLEITRGHYDSEFTVVNPDSYVEQNPVKAFFDNLISRIVSFFDSIGTFFRSIFGKTPEIE